MKSAIKQFISILVVIFLSHPVSAAIDNQMFVENVGNITIDVTIQTQKDTEVKKRVRAHDKDWIHLGNDCAKQVMLSYSNKELGSHQTSWTPPATDCTSNLIIGVTKEKNDPVVLHHSVREAVQLESPLFSSQEGLTVSDHIVFVDNISGIPIVVTVRTQNNKSHKKWVDRYDMEWIHIGYDCVRSITMENCCGGDPQRTQWIPPFPTCTCDIEIYASGNKNYKPVVTKYTLKDEDGKGDAPTYIFNFAPPPSLEGKEWHEKNYEKDKRICSNYKEIRNQDNSPASQAEIMKKLQELGYKFLPCTALD